MQEVFHGGKENEAGFTKTKNNCFTARSAQKLTTWPLNSGNPQKVQHLFYMSRMCDGLLDLPTYILRAQKKRQIFTLRLIRIQFLYQYLCQNASLLIRILY